MFDKIVVITKKTPLEELIERFNTLSQAKFYIEHSGQSFKEYEAYHNAYQKSLAKLRQSIPVEMKTQFIERGFLTNFLFGDKDLVITLGPDGLVVNTAKYLNGQFIMAVNPDSSRIDGILVPFLIDNIAIRLETVLGGEFRHEDISMAKVKLDNGQTLYAVNDFFVGPKSHTCLRYTIKHAGHAEEQMSSGLIISTGAGSTGWFRAVVAGAEGVYTGFTGGAARAGSGERTKPGSTQVKVDQSGSSAAGKSGRASQNTSFDRSSDELVFMVREPFESKTSKADLIFGKVTPNSPLTIVSHTPSGGVIFSDGIESDYLEFNSGRTAVITIAEKKVKLIRLTV
jgi:NAD kinase